MPPRLPISWKSVALEAVKWIGVVGVLGGAWITMGGWVPASSQQLSSAVRRIELRLAQADTQIYGAEVDRLITRGGQIDREIEASPTPSPFLKEQQQITEEQLKNARKKLEDAQEEQRELRE